MTAADRVRDPKLVAGYRECRRLTRRHGTTYYWGAVLLPPRQRRHVYAVYALCRLADDIVDLPETLVPGPNPTLPEPNPTLPGPNPTLPGPNPTLPEPNPTLPEPNPTLPERVEGQWESSWALRQAQGANLGSSPAERLTQFASEFRSALASGDSDDPVMAAIVSTARHTQIDPECFDRFFAAMAMDLDVSSYETWDDLCGYMEGSAAVIGEMMLPVLEPTSPAAKEPARALGFAFQLTNFIRDVAEDLDRGRVYMPQEDLRRFGVDLGLRRATPEWQACAAYEIERNRALYRFADTGIALLPPRSARCVGAARVLYSQILDRIERADYDVFSRRARVPMPRKALTAGRIMVAGPAG